MPFERRYPIGVEFLSDGTPHARVWAPRRRRVDVMLTNMDGTALGSTELTNEGNGYFSGSVEHAADGSLYLLRLDAAHAYPDPASRFQPTGPHGPSQVVDPARFRWSDAAWPGVEAHGQVLYELHIGTFTEDGTFRGAIERLPALVETGVTVVEVMPVAEFPGRFGWGYDGVDLFAPTRLYGAPDDFRAFVDAAHATGLGVILDVVYNHLGPDGCYLREFSDWYFSPRHKTEWGEALNFDAEHSAPVREHVLTNVAYWIEEFHLDGLRLDATQQIFDDSPSHILAEITATVRRAAGGRSTLVVGENEPQEAKLLRCVPDGGYGLDAVWNDDFHHAARVALTGRDEAYYSGYRGSAQEFVSAAKHGYLYQGTWYAWQHKRRGTPARDLAPERFVQFIQNHDQVANSMRGKRVRETTSPGRYRAMTALLLLLPQMPMLFMGEEFGASAPFLYFADHRPELARLVKNGRDEFLAQFPSLDTPEGRAQLADPADPETFTRCKLDWLEHAAHRADLALHRDLLRLRREDPVLAVRERGALDGAVITDDAFAIRWSVPAGDRLLIVNFGRRLHADPWPEPLVATPPGTRWSVLWSSEDPLYGGYGTPPVDTADDGWWIVAEAAVLLTISPSAHAPVDR